MRSTTAPHQSGIGSATVELNYGAFFDRFQKNALSQQKVLRPSSMPEANAMGIADDGKTFGVPAANTMTFSERG
jgi:hypothetical protein